MIALRELAERWKAVPSVYGSAEETYRECAAELLAILDAEGGGEVVWMLDSGGCRTYWPSADVAAHEQDNLRTLGYTATVTPLYTRPARSGVVRDEDVEAACRVNYESDGNSKWDKLAECWKVKHRTAMRAALEHFAKGERHE